MRIPFNQRRFPTPSTMIQGDVMTSVCLAMILTFMVATNKPIVLGLDVGSVPTGGTDYKILLSTVKYLF